MKYTIPEHKIKSVIKKLESLNKRLYGHNGSLIDYTTSLMYEKTIDKIIIDKKTNEPIKIQTLVNVVDIEVINPVISLNGWSFLAIIEHSKKGNIVLKKLYDVEVPEKYLTSSTYCEHCNTNRYRKFTYLVYNENTKEISQVGSTCLTAYLGFDASILLAHAELFNKMYSLETDEHEQMVKRGVESQLIENFLKRSIVIIEKMGYVSAKKVRETVFDEDNILTPTGYLVWDIEYNKRWKQEILEATNDTNVQEKYNQIIKWVNEQEKKTDYIHNIKVLIDRGYVTYKTATIAASIVGVWMANEAKKKIESNIVSDYFGIIGKRIDVDMVLKTKTSFEGQYGISNCYRFITKDGNIAVWFTAAAQLEEGAHYVGKATITKHDEYKGVKQTLLNRCKLTEV